MANTLLLRGGTTQEVAAATLAEREVMVDTTTDQLVVGPSKNYMAIGSNATFTGTSTFTGDVLFQAGVTFGTGINANSLRIQNVATPTSPSDAANKSYVDTEITNLSNTLLSGNITSIDNTIDITESSGTVDLSVADGAVTTAKIALNAVTEAQIAQNAVTTTKIQDSAVTNAKLANFAVSTAKILEGAITTNRLADDSVTADKLADGSVSTLALDTNSVSTAKLQDGSVTTPKLADQAVTTVKIDNDAVTTNKLGNLSVTTAKIADAAVTSAKLDPSILTTHANQVTAAQNAATAAASSAASALAAFDNFDDTYLGAKASDPSTDNDGDPLDAGDLYFNTTDDVMRLYTGTQWVTAYVPGEAVNISYDNASSGLTASNVQAAIDELDTAIVATDLGHNITPGQITISSSTGSNTTIYDATSNLSGWMSSSDKAKLSTVSPGAAPTNATTVAAAGAVMESDTTTASMSFVVDEDNMVSNSDTKIPTQQSVKAYVDAEAATKLPLAGGTMTGNIVMSGAQTVDGRDLSVDGAKLDGIEAGATADQTKADIDALGIDASTLDGINSTSFLRSNVADTKTAGNLTFNDNVEARFGANANLRIYHSGGTSYVAQTGPGSLLLSNTNDDSDVVIQTDNGSGGVATYLLADGSTGQLNLYHYGSLKANTDSAGFSVTGNITVSGTVDGRDVAVDGAKLDGIEAGATADQDASEVSYDPATSGMTATDVQDAIDELDNRLDNSANTGTSGPVFWSRSGTTVSPINSGDDVSVNGDISVTGNVDGRDVSVDGAKLDGIEAGATADQTASEILTAIKTVDGTGSGLDADTVDGLNSTQFLRSDASDIATGPIAWNGTLAIFDPPGGGSGSDTANDVAIALANGHRIAGWDNGYIRTLFEWNVSSDIEIGQGNTSLIGGINLLPGASGQAKVNGNTIWHAGNDGASSGLDADTLDGQEGSYYLDYNNLTNVPSGGSTNADTLDNLDSTQFLRSDTADTFTGTALTINSATDAKLVMRVNASDTSDWNYIEFRGANGTRDGYLGTNQTGTMQISQDGGSYLQLSGTAGTANINGNTIWTSGNDGSASGLDADTLDGVQGSGYLRSSVADNFSGLYLRFNDFKELQFGGGDDLTIKSDGTDALFDTRSGANITFSNAGTGRISFDMLNGGIATAGAITVNGSTVWHAGNDGSGSGLDADYLDGLNSGHFERRSSASGSVSTVGWYTIAVNAGNRASAKFNINDQTSGAHQSVHFHAAHMYGQGNSITVLSNVYYGSSPIRYIRIKEGSTYDGALLQVYLDSNFSGNWNITENYQSGGWVVTSLTADGTDPGTVSNFSNLTNVAVQVDVDQGPLPGRGGNINTTGDIYAGGTTTQYKVWHAGNDGSGGGLDADTLDGVQGSSYLRSDVADTYTNLAVSGSTNGGSFTNVGTWGTRHNTSHGYIDLGPANSSFAHIYTDRPEFYFNAPLKRSGNTVWDSGNDGPNSGLVADHAWQPYVDLDSSTNANRYLTFADSTTAGYQSISVDSTLKYNPFTGTLTAINFAGTLVGTAQDADTVDGIHASSFLRSDVQTGNQFLRFEAAHGNGIRFWNSSSYSIWMSASSNGTYGGRLDSTSDYNMYFKMTSGTNRGFVFKNGATNVAQIEGNGNIRCIGNVYANNGVLLGSSTDPLDEYEEGTFTPTIQGATTAGSATYTHQDGKYTRVGNVVYFDIHLEWANFSGQAGDIQVAGLPFTINSADEITPVNIIYQGIYVGNKSYYTPSQAGAALDGTTVIKPMKYYIYYSDPSAIYMTSTGNYNTSSQLYCSGTYTI